MRVLFLGAGASHDAGYPLASGLREALSSEARTTSVADVQGGWDKFEEFVAGTEAALKRILENSNPEVALTLLDLLRAARKSEREDWERRRIKLRGQPLPGSPDGHPWSEEPKEFAGVEVALQGLLHCLDKFFLSKHWQDREAEGASRRAYLARELKSLKPGDVVITTNWDSLVERVLLERGAWKPAEGYGFDVELVSYTGGALPPELRVPSKIKVLKLHGSCGWYLDRQERIYLSYGRFLQHLPLLNAGSEGFYEVFYKDAAEPLIRSGSDPQALIYPTYLKRLEYRQLQEIWSGAAEALYRADEFRAFGYSLPASDTAIQVLLNPLRARRELDQLRIDVYDPDGETRERWEALLGEGIAHESRIGQDGG